MADDLAAWLTQIWDGREKAARAATAGPWRYNSQKHTRLPDTPFFEEAVFAGNAGAAATTIAATGETDDPQSMADAAFIAANDPASVLAHIAADRQILALHQPFSLDFDRITGCKTCSYRDDYEELQVAWPCPTLRLLAQPYADRPGYQEEWRP